MAFLHGVDTQEIKIGTETITEVKSAVIGLVGTAPKGPINKPTLVYSASDAAQFGTFAEHGLTSGYSIPAAIDAIHAHGAGTIVVVNVFIPSENTETEKTITDEVLTFAEDNKATVTHPEKVSNLVLTSADGATIYELNTDYTFDAETGAITKVAEGALAEVASVKANYKYVETIKTDNNVKDIAAADIIGSTSEKGERTGLQALEDVFSLYGFNPKILICPGWSEQNGVREAMLTIAEKLRAICLIDAPVGVSVTDCITARGAEGTFDWQTTSERAYLLYPHVKRYDQETDADQLCPYSSVMAGLIAQTDRDDGYWFSPSNRSISRITGVERKLTSRYSDPNCEVNRLNEKGITSILNDYGTGYKSYGNRLANFPGISGITTFITCRRVADMIEDTLEQNMAQFIDRPLNSAIISDIISLGSSYLRKLEARGAIIGGTCYASSEDNTAESLADGRLVVYYEFTPPAALERITNKVVLTNKYYGS